MFGMGRGWRSGSGSGGRGFILREDARQPECFRAIVFVRVQPGNLFGVEELIEGNSDGDCVAAFGAHRIL